MEFKFQSPDPHLYKELLSCYKKCLQNKRHVKKTRFHLHHEFLINQLALDIENNTYYPCISSVFVVLNPKPREVVAASLRDRIVHHYIYQHMENYWERRFVPNTYVLLSEFKTDNLGKPRLSIPNETFHPVTKRPSDRRLSNLRGTLIFFCML